MHPTSLDRSDLLPELESHSETKKKKENAFARGFKSHTMGTHVGGATNAAAGDRHRKCRYVHVKIRSPEPEETRR